jgi:hypothetical protein
MFLILLNIVLINFLIIKYAILFFISFIALKILIEAYFIKHQKDLTNNLKFWNQFYLLMILLTFIF